MEKRLLKLVNLGKGVDQKILLSKIKENKIQINEIARNIRLSRTVIWMALHRYRPSVLWKVNRYVEERISKKSSLKEVS